MTNPAPGPVVCDGSAENYYPLRSFPSLLGAATLRKKQDLLQQSDFTGGLQAWYTVTVATTAGEERSSAKHWAITKS